MSDVTYDAEKLANEATLAIEGFKSQMKDIAEQAIGNLYVNVIPYLETDAWTNYRESLRLDLEHEYKFSTFRQDWATNFRRAVFVENRDEMADLISADILKRIKHLEDCRQEFDQFRYSPGGDRYQDLKRRLDGIEKALENHATGPIGCLAEIRDLVRAGRP